MTTEAVKELLELLELITYKLELAYKEIDKINKKLYTLTRNDGTAEDDK